MSIKVAKTVEVVTAIMRCYSQVVTKKWPHNSAYGGYKVLWVEFLKLLRENESLRAFKESTLEVYCKEMKELMISAHILSKKNPLEELESFDHNFLDSSYNIDDFFYNKKYPLGFSMKKIDGESLSEISGNELTLLQQLFDCGQAQFNFDKVKQVSKLYLLF